MTRAIGKMIAAVGDLRTTRKSTTRFHKDVGPAVEEAKQYADYPGGHNEAYPDAPKFLFRNVYGFIAGQRPGGDFATFLDGHNENAICDAVLKSGREKQWVEVEY